MTRKKFLEWGQTWHYPQLVLSSSQVLRHGKTHYEAATATMIQLASVRIARWNTLMMAGRVDNVIQHVDKMLTTCSADTTDRLTVERGEANGRVSV